MSPGRPRRTAAGRFTGLLLDILFVRAAVPQAEGCFVTARDAAYHVFAGEETASVAFGPMLAAVLGAGQKRIGVSRAAMAS